MKRSKSVLWASILALTVALATTTASAQEPGTVTITGTFTMQQLDGTVGSDLAAIYDEGAEYTWTLSMRDSTNSHRAIDGSRFTYVRSTSFELEFFGPEAEALNAIMSAGLEGGAVWLELRNAVSFATMTLTLEPPEGGGMWFWTGHEWNALFTLFPVDEDGFPVLGSEPFAFPAEGPYIFDYRSGNAGSIISWQTDLTIAGNIGSPVPTTMRIGDAVVLEGDRGSRKVTLGVGLTSPSGHAITVSYRTVDGTAVSVGGKNNKADYTAASGTLTFQPGETGKSITISIKSDRAAEADETFTVELFNVSGTTIDDGVATVTIANDD